MALGPVDYGLLGIIGGLVVFITLINNVLATAVSRFYAFSIGKERGGGAAELDDCRRWFNVAVLLHTVVPLLLIVAGYPLGIYAIRYCLTIPMERIDACIWVFRFVCMSSFISMVCVPYKAMYTAKQLIAELTVFSVAQTLFYTSALFYMVGHEGDWLVPTAIVMGFQVVVVDLLLSLRGVVRFPECKFSLNYMIDRGRIVELASFAGWQFIGTLGVALRGQGVGILVNKFFGPVMNATYGIALTVAGRTQTFAAEINTAFQPAIVSAYGAGNRDLYLPLVYRCCKFGSWFTCLLVTPLVVEMPEVMRLWLKTPPPKTAGLCACICLMIVLEQLIYGFTYAAGAVGRIKHIQILSCLSLFLSFAVIWGAFMLGGGVYIIGFTFVGLACFECGAKVWIAHRVAQVPLRPWFYHVVFPVLTISLVAGLISAAARLVLEPSFLRVVVSSMLFLFAYLPLSWYGALSSQECEFVRVKILGLINKRRSLCRH